MANFSQQGIEVSAATLVIPIDMRDNRIEGYSLRSEKEEVQVVLAGEITRGRPLVSEGRYPLTSQVILAFHRIAVRTSVRPIQRVPCQIDRRKVRSSGDWQVCGRVESGCP